MKKNANGIILVLIISILSLIMHKYLLSFLETLTIGIILGIIYTNTIGINPNYHNGISFCLKKILKWGIVLLGAKLNFSLLLNLGPKIIILIIVIISTALISSYYIGTSYRLNSKLSVLLGVGSSICGASAIVAMGPVIEATEDDIAISVTVISLLGALGVLIYSILSAILPLTDIQYGVWSGSSLQGVAHALAAASARGTTSLSLEIGTIVKMARVALLAPISIILGFLFRKDNNKKKVKFPYYILYFILLGIIFTLNDKFHFFITNVNFFNTNISIIDFIKEASNFFILMAMVAMGLNVNLRFLEKKVYKSIVVCGIVFFILSLLSITMILFLNIN